MGMFLHLSLFFKHVVKDSLCSASSEREGEEKRLGTLAKNKGGKKKKELGAVLVSVVMAFATSFSDYVS